MTRNIAVPPPRKRFGQHFLHDQQCIARIIHALRPKPGDHLVEIGPGQGALTIPVLQDAKALTAVELDRDLIPILEEGCAPLGRLTIYQQDVLRFNFSEIPLNFGEKLRIFGNLPYNISTPLLFHLLDFTSIISDMHFMLQKEVAERIAAPVDSEHYGRLSVMMQYACEAELLFTIGPEAFQPPPKVDSAIIRITPHQHLPWTAKNPALFAELVKLAFNQRRKTLRNSLKSLVTQQDWDNMPIDSQLRAEALSVKDFVAISNYLSGRV